ncbi:MAG TPA: hypothetical protein VEA77_03065 [Hyphomicrobium sp.]|nr:hypothetical protein [Hyphomicrobium sp.]
MATAAPLKVSIVMTNFQKASAVMEGLNAAKPFLQMVPGVDKLFPGGPSEPTGSCRRWKRWVRESSKALVMSSKRLMTKPNSTGGSATGKSSLATRSA